MPRTAGAPPASGDVAGEASARPDLSVLKRYFTEAQQLTQAARTHSLTAIDYYDSDQFTREYLQALEERSQPPITLNRIKPAINGIIGITEKSRSDPRCRPRATKWSDAWSVRRCTRWAGTPSSSQRI